MTVPALFWLFAKFSLLCFGGGYMLIPLFFADCVEQRGLLSAEELGNLISVAQLTPGPVGINAATYLGFRMQGLVGAAAATLGLVLPTLLLGSLAVMLLRRYEKSFLISGLLRGTRLAAQALVLSAALIFLKLAVDFSSGADAVFGGAVVALSLLAVSSRRIPVTAVMLAGAVLGVLYRLWC